MFRSQNVVNFLVAALVVTDSMFFAAVAYADGGCHHDDYREAYYWEKLVTDDTCQCVTEAGGGGGIVSVAAPKYFLTSIVLVNGQVCEDGQNCEGTCKIVDGWDDGECYECAETDKNCVEEEKSYIHFHYPSGCAEEAEEGEPAECKCVETGAPGEDQGLRTYTNAKVTDC